jgi:hypothetical protein
MFPTVKPTKFTYELEEIFKVFSREVNSEKIKKVLPRLHQENSFNKRFSGVLEVFEDIKSITERITENIGTSLIIEREIQKREEIDQDLHRKAGKLTSQNKTDLKSLYVNAKIFLDEYTNFLCWIFGWQGIDNSSITKFYKALEKYNGHDLIIQSFKERCFNKIKAIDVYITGYRDKDIVHTRDKHKKDTKWFVNEMNGAVRFIGGNRPSITPQEILFIVVEYVDVSTQFCLEWLNNQINYKIQLD